MGARGFFDNSGNPAANGKLKNSGNCCARGKLANAGNAGAKGKFANVGNARARGKVANVGNVMARGYRGNSGNAKPNRSRGNPGNKGNVSQGAVKKSAGKRSGVKRSAKRALVVKKEWLDLILAKEKTWEIRGSRTVKRGWIHFAESQGGGKLIGRARLVDCFALCMESFADDLGKHRLRAWPVYQTPYVWVLKDAEKFDKPFDYQHKQGAVIWVDV